MDTPVVTIKQGQLKGCIRTDIDGGRILTFLGIPYAKPPVGELRFKVIFTSKFVQSMLDNLLQCMLQCLL